MFVGREKFFLFPVLLGDNTSGGVDEEAEYIILYSYFLILSIFVFCILILYFCWLKFFIFPALGDNKSGGVDEQAEYMNKFVRA